MLWAAVSVAFFGFLRCAEFTVPSLASYDPAIHLSLADVSATPSSTISRVAIRIKQSKTDQFGRGVTIYLERTGAALCPVSPLLDYLVPGSAGHLEWPIVSFCQRDNSIQG